MKMDMTQEIDIKDRLKTILYCLLAITLLGIIILFIDPNLDEHLYLLSVPFGVSIISAIGVVVIYFVYEKKKKH